MFYVILQEGWTPLHISMQSRNRDIAKILLVNGADKTRTTKVSWQILQQYVDELVTYQKVALFMGLL